MSVRDFLKRNLVSDETDTIIDQIPKPVGSFGYDPWGYNTESLKVALSVFKPIYEKYFRVEATGLENVPKQGDC